MFPAVLAALAALTALALGAPDASAQSATAAPEFAPRPEWVLPAELPAPRDERIGEVSGGRYYLLYDTQIRAEGDSTVEYFRIASKAIDPAALESLGRLTFNFDPLTSRLVLHSITVWRDGEALDRLTPETFEVVRQEPELYDGMVLGDLTAFTHIPDVRVGDVVDYEWSYVSSWPLWPGGVAGYFSFDFSEPLEERRLRLLTPSGTPVEVATRALDFEPKVRVTGGEIERVWRRRDVTPTLKEASAPNWVSQYGFVEISSMTSWGDVADWGRAVADVDMTLPDGALEKALGGSAEGLTRAQKVSRVIRFVQDEIRYVGDEVGLGSHVPRPPARALALGYGDCKDKSLLLVAFLRALGLEATPSLAHSRKGRSLPDRLPSPYVFNHMIVRISEGARHVWIDPTVTHQGGTYPYYVAPDFGYALPLVEGQDALAPIPFESRAFATLRIVETFDFGNLAEEGLGLDVASTYRGREADSYRSKLAREPRASIEATYLDYYRGLYPGIGPSRPMKVTDNREANVIVVHERYRLPPDAFFAETWREALPLRADAVLALATTEGAAGRRFPVAIEHPLHREHVHRLVNLPDSFVPVAERSETDAASYFLSSRSSEDLFEISNVLKTRRNMIEPEGLGAYNRFVKFVDDAAYVSYSFMDKSREPKPAQSRLHEFLNALGFGARASE